VKHLQGLSDDSERPQAIPCRVAVAVARVLRGLVAALHTVPTVDIIGRLGHTDDRVVGDEGEESSVMVLLHQHGEVAPILISTEDPGHHDDWLTEVICVAPGTLFATRRGRRGAAGGDVRPDVARRLVDRHRKAFPVWAALVRRKDLKVIELPVFF
jgi:hypothetical protein